MKILVIGESCKDIWKYGRVERLDPAAPAPVHCPLEVKVNDGMAANVFNNLKSLGVDVHMHTNENWSEVTKTRFVDKKTNYILLREDMNDGKFGRCDLDIIDFNNFDAVIISDYNKGFLERGDIKKICKLHPLVFLDTKKEIGKWAECVNYIKINNYELSKAREVTSKLKERLIITLGSAGASHKNTIYPVPSVEIKDLSGCGDTFLAGLATSYLKDRNVEKAIKFANQCATIAATKSGVVIINEDMLKVFEDSK